MRSSIIVAAGLGSLALAAPAPPAPELNINAAMPNGVNVVSDYFNILAQKVQESRWMSAAPVCDLSKASMPQVAGISPPTPGFTLKHVAVGRGTQNYTCDTKNATAIPVAAGAVATLFNASCVASTYPDLSNMLPRVALQFNLTSPELPRMAPSNLAISGKHFFTNATTPYFTLDTPAQQLGTAPCAKNSSAPAPAGAPAGQQGEPAVPWLKLTTRLGATGDLQEVFRVETAGGSAPATCKGMPAAFEVQYAAQYWFFEGKPQAP